jgi:2-polyprenyl-3-methyl-5-hydroxy-6-metoxy-1,4-benzoquinol methylase
MQGEDKFMNRVIAFFMFFIHAPGKTFNMFASQIRGLAFLLTHPQQFRHIVVRETKYGQRLRSKQKWVEWQIYDTCVGNVLHTSEVARAQPLNVERLETIADMFRRLRSGLQVLDVGCGEGSIGKLVEKLGHSVVSVEIPKAATVAKRLGVSEIVAGDAERLSFSSNNFDVVVASEVVEHLWDPNNLFDEAYRVLRANGYLLISTPEGRKGLFYDSHKHFFTVESLERMLAGRFILLEVRHLKPSATLMPTIILLFRKSG